MAYISYTSIKNILECPEDNQKGIYICEDDGRIIYVHSIIDKENEEWMKVKKDFVELLMAKNTDKKLKLVETLNKKYNIEITVNYNDKGKVYFDNSLQTTIIDAYNNVTTALFPNYKIMKVKNHYDDTWVYILCWEIDNIADKLSKKDIVMYKYNYCLHFLANLNTENVNIIKTLCDIREIKFETDMLFQ